MTPVFSLAPLPYAPDALEPVISANTVGFHYGKHHRAYVETLNTLVEGTRYEKMPLEQIVLTTGGTGRDNKERKIFNNAAQVWNHDFYWRSLSPTMKLPAGRLEQAITQQYGDRAALVKKLADAGKAQFGSGWGWLVSRDGKLDIVSTPNAENPMSNGINCLLAIDVWEHAYYLDYQNGRADYLSKVLDRLLNWEFATQNFDREDEIVRAAA